MQRCLQFIGYGGHFIKGKEVFERDGCVHPSLMGALPAGLRLFVKKVQPTVSYHYRAIQ